MIINLYMEEQLVRQNKWWFSLDGTNEVIARAVNGANMNTCLWFGDSKYKFHSIPKLIKIEPLSFKYPYYYNLKKIPGFQISKDKEVIVKYHADDLKCNENNKDHHLGVNVFYFENETYLQFYVGLPKHRDNYFCLFKENGELVSIIARHNGGKDYDNCKATLYVEDDKYLLITLLTCATEMIDIVNYWDDHHYNTAGSFTSKLEAERAMYDAEFIERVKRNGNNNVSIPKLLISETDKKLATEMRDDEKEKKQINKLESRWKMVIYFVVILFIVTSILQLLGISDFTWSWIF